MSCEGSVTHWIRQLELGDDEAARQLWHRYFEKLVRLARKRLGSSPRRVADEEDVALTVFRCLSDGAAKGRFSELANRDELWRLVVGITSQKVIDHVRFLNQKKRGSGKVRGDSAFVQGEEDDRVAGFDQLVSDDPTPEFLTTLADEHQRLMSLLREDQLRQIALLKFEGYTNEEIAREIGLTVRSIERKLFRIRYAWTGELEP